MRKTSEAAVVKRIFKRFVEIQSPKQIACELNWDGIVPRTGNPWTTGYIYRILSNYTYVGDVLFKGNVFKGEHDGIISRNVWERVREITSSRDPYDHSREVAALTVPLKGILRCGHCGCSMKPVFTKKGKRRYFYYYCSQDTKRGEKTCPVGKIGAATVEGTVRDQAQKIFQSPYFLERISSKTGLTIPEVRSCFTEEFWNETNGAELNRIYSELFEKIILKEVQIVFEIKTAGIQALTEEEADEHQ